VAIILMAGVTAPASPHASPAASIRLTAIEDRFSGAACRLTLDSAGKRLVGGMDYFNENRAWHLGINGRDHALRESPGPKIAFMSKDRTIRGEVAKLKRVWTSNDPGYPAERHKVSVSLTVNGARTIQTAYLTCGDG
jgi:hypothetical protein